MKKKVAIIMGSDSDFPKVQPAIDLLKELGIETTVRVISAHRTPTIAAEFASKAKENGYGAILAAAGKAAHLGGVLAAYTTLPVIGIPISAGVLDGMDALLATVQMPSGVPVATVAIDGAYNAGLLAAQMLGIYEEEIAEKIVALKQKQTDAVIEKDKELQNKL